MGSEDGKWGASPEARSSGQKERKQPVPDTPPSRHPKLRATPPGWRPLLAKNGADLKNWWFGSKR